MLYQTVASSQTRHGKRTKAEKARLIDKRIARKESSMVGAWKIAKMKTAKLPEKVATGFKQATDGLKGARYRPVLYCGKQIVSGTNHLIICKQTLSDKDKTEHMVEITLHQPQPKAGKKWKIVSIKPLI